MKKFACLIFFSSLFISCELMPADENTKVYYKEDIIAVFFSTQGGGDILFNITPTSSQYTIKVTEQNFQSVDISIALTSADAAVLNLLVNRVLLPLLHSNMLAVNRTQLKMSPLQVI